MALRADLLRRATTTVAAAYGELEGTLASTVAGARDGSRAFSALTVSADAASSAPHVGSFSLCFIETSNDHNAQSRIA